MNTGAHEGGERPCTRDDISIQGVWHNDSTAGAAAVCDNPRHEGPGHRPKWAEWELIYEDSFSLADLDRVIAAHLEQFGA